MIVRTWHGVVPREKGDAFGEHLLKTGMAEAKNIRGNLGNFMYSQPQAEWVHVFMVSYWKDIQSVKAFAGDDYQVAVTYPGDEAFDLISDPIVLHHEVGTVPQEFPLRIKEKE